MTTTTEDYRASNPMGDHVNLIRAQLSFGHPFMQMTRAMASDIADVIEAMTSVGIRQESEIERLRAELNAIGAMGDTWSSQRATKALGPAPETCDGLPASQEPKYTVSQGRLVNRSTGKPIPDDEPVFILRAKDRVAVYAIMAYRAQCTGNPEHHDAVDARVGDFLRFKEMHPQRMKSPDTAALKASRSPGDLSPEEFQEAWRKANELKANEQRPLVYPDMWPCKYPRMAGSIAQDCEYPNCDCGPEEGKASDGRCPDCGVGAEFDGVWHKPGCPQL